jgi:hypothetical protein
MAGRVMHQEGGKVPQEDALWQLVIPAKLSCPALGRGTREGMKMGFSKEAGIYQPRFRSLRMLPL